MIRSARKHRPSRSGPTPPLAVAGRPGPLWPLAVLCSVTLACVADGTAPALPPEVAFVTILPVAFALEPGDTVRLTAIPRGALGDPVQIPDRPRWRSENEAVATVDSAGLVRAAGAGETGIVAALGGALGRARVSVLPVAARAAAYVEVRTGGDHTCAVTTDMAISCWGLNLDGQLGNGSFVGGARPTAVAGVVRATAVDAGARHTCAITADGEVGCWGWNSVRQVGPAAASKRVAEPATVPLAGRFTGIALGSGHSCVLEADGTAWCWGSDAVGQLGDGEGAAERPVRVESGVRLTAIAAGHSHVCALDDERRAWCWGWNAYGQLGGGEAAGECAPNSACARKPQPVAGGRTWLAITAGFAFSCGLDERGRAWCWGGNSVGQLGSGNTRPSTVPVPVASNLTFVGVDAGTTHACALTVDGEAWCWGGNESGQLGEEDHAFRTEPVRARVLTAAARSISAGDSHTCAILLTRTIRCWGTPVDGRLGPFAAGLQGYRGQGANAILAGGANARTATISDQAPRGRLRP